MGFNSGFKGLNKTLIPLLQPPDPRINNVRPNQVYQHEGRGPLLNSVTNAPFITLQVYPALVSEPWHCKKESISIPIMAASRQEALKPNEMLQ